MGIYTKFLKEISLDGNQLFNQISNLCWSIYTKYKSNKQKADIEVIKNILVFNHPIIVQKELKDKSKSYIGNDVKIVNRNYENIVNYVIHNFYTKFCTALERDSISEKELKDNIRILNVFYNDINSFYFIFEFENIKNKNYKIPTLNIGIHDDRIDYQIISYKDQLN